jgi:uncharacterized phage-associated protein
MIKHYVIMSSSYSDGCRIALDLTGDDINQKIITKMMEQIKGECGGDVSLSSHCFEADSEKWEDVIKHDGFFENVKVISSVDEFMSLINKDRQLTGLDVAKYILSKIECDHIKLEKLVYFCFAKYLTKTNKRLFDDKIYAFSRGPVVQSVYEEFKYKTGLLKYSLAKESRILFAKDGVDKLDCIVKTIEQYGSKTGDELVNITHRESSPWSVSYIEGKLFLEIPIDAIKERYKFEAA